MILEVLLCQSKINTEVIQSEFNGESRLAANITNNNLLFIAQIFSDAQDCIAHSLECTTEEYDMFCLMEKGASSISS